MCPWGGRRKRKKRISSLARMIKTMWGSFAKRPNSLRLSRAVPRLFTYSACAVSLRWAEPASSSPGWEMGNCSGGFGDWVGNGNVHLAGTHCSFPYKEKTAVILKYVWFEAISPQVLIIHTTKFKKKAKQKKRNHLRILEGKGGLNQTKWWNQCPCI